MLRTCCFVRKGAAARSPEPCHHPPRPWLSGGSSRSPCTRRRGRSPRDRCPIPCHRRVPRAELSTADPATRVALRPPARRRRRGARIALRFSHRPVWRTDDGPTPGLGVPRQHAGGPLPLRGHRRDRATRSRHPPPRRPGPRPVRTVAPLTAVPGTVPGAVPGAVRAGDGPHARRQVKREESTEAAQPEPDPWSPARSDGEPALRSARRWPHAAMAGSTCRRSGTGPSRGRDSRGRYPRASPHRACHARIVPISARSTRSPTAPHARRNGPSPAARLERGLCHRHLIGHAVVLRQSVPRTGVPPARGRPTTAATAGGAWVKWVRIVGREGLDEALPGGTVSFWGGGDCRVVRGAGLLR